MARNYVSNLYMTYFGLPLRANQILSRSADGLFLAQILEAFGHKKTVIEF